MGHLDNLGFFSPAGMITALWLQDLRNSTDASPTSPTTSRRSASRTHMETSRRRITTSDGGMKGNREFD